MMSNIEFAAIRPFAILVIGVFFDQMVAHGILNPGEKDVWVNGALAIMGNLFAMVMIAISLWHAHLDVHKKPTTTKTTTTIDTPTTEPQTVTTETMTQDVAVQPTSVLEYLTK